MATRAANHIFYLLATGAIDFANDSFKIILMDTGFSFDVDTHEVYADVSANELPTGAGYTQNNKVLANVVVTEDDVDDRTEITWDNVSWVAAGGSIGPTPGAIIFDDTHASDAIVGYIDFGTEYTQVDGGTFTIAAVEIRMRHPN